MIAVDMIKIIAHRGYWHTKEEQNSQTAFVRALKCGFGIETDFRDFDGQLVISHDIPTKQAMPAAEFSDFCRSFSPCGPIAMNVKSDGLHRLIVALAHNSALEDFFVFDMSIPDTRGYLSSGIPVYTRISEFERTAIFLDHCAGVWLDCFESDWYPIDLVNELLASQKKVAIVSPELHRRDHSPLWQSLRTHKLHFNPSLSLCTDFPADAREFFYGQ